MVQTYLARVGVRPFNAIVDTIIFDDVTGQPLHAFDTTIS
jgi:phenylalanyl-tRNA synthetase beta subunit